MMSRSVRTGAQLYVPNLLDVPGPDKVALLLWRPAIARCGVLVYPLPPSSRAGVSAPPRGRGVRAVEGARLESVCIPKRCTVGSNPTLSANLTLPGPFADYMIVRAWWRVPVPPRREVVNPVRPEREQRQQRSGCWGVAGTGRHPKKAWRQFRPRTLVASVLRRLAAP